MEGLPGGLQGGCCARRGFALEGGGAGWGQGKMGSREGVSYRRVTAGS